MRQSISLFRNGKEDRPGDKQLGHDPPSYSRTRVMSRLFASAGVVPVEPEVLRHWRLSRWRVVRRRWRFVEGQKDLVGAALRLRERGSY